ncbi:helix-turn-helix domain-containing protein [Candidatus Sororendozoicomonas aggregata]|uniref:helix-turn-helix domain-containing protein n=1 Tax=Candidatus Sororendozoicomonas aggregata TaxID=3073239 RepID=UPI002ED4201D
MEKSWYHYIECGLPAVYLENGFARDSVDGEQCVGVDSVDQLHRTIATTLTGKSTALTGEEVRFLRVEMNLSQKRLGTLLGVEDQTVARWEKNSTPLPRTSDVALRALYLESINKGSVLSSLLKMLAESDSQQAMSKLVFVEVNDRWQLSA